MAAALVSLFPPGGVAAQSQMSVAASPAFQVATAAAGQSATFLIDVRNFNAHDPLPVTFELADLTPRGWLAVPHSTPFSLVGLAALPEGTTLRPGETKTVAVVVRGDGAIHYGGLIVVGGPASAPLVRIVLKIVLTAPDARPKPDVNVTPSSSGTVKLDLRNVGEGVLSAHGVVFFIAADGRFIGRLDIPRIAILPHGEGSLTLQWPETLVPGTIARAMILQEGRDTPFTVDSSVP